MESDVWLNRPGACRGDAGSAATAIPAFREAADPLQGAAMCESQIQEYNERRQTEDGLLNARSNMIIAANGLAAVAIGQNIPLACKGIVGAAILMTNVLWLIRAIEARQFIRALVEKVASLPSEILRNEVVVSKRRFKIISSSCVFAICVPILLLMAWTGGLIVGLIGLCS
jgi:hypothetical protein